MDGIDGGLGADAPNLKDTRMQERAIRERWPISDKVRARVLQRLCNIVDEDHVHPGEPPSLREVIAASRAILSADKLNLEQARFDHLTKPPEKAADDYELDLSSRDEAPNPP